MKTPFIQSRLRTARFWAVVPLCILLLSISCKKALVTVTPTVTDTAKFNMSQTLSDDAQINTIAFAGLAFMNGNLGSQTFFPPGKVADYSGFQYLRDNDPTGMGHNTSFLTTIAYNILNILTTEQRQMLVDAAGQQVQDISTYAYMRFPLCKAFRRQLENDLPAGTTQLDAEAIKAYSATLYQLDGKISYERALVFGNLTKSLSAAQLNAVKALMQLNGVGNWNKNLTDPMLGMHLNHEISVAVMTYVSEWYAWYSGSVTADVYFCPERHGTYFGSFYLKDWPAIGNPNYSINEQLTASAGKEFLSILTAEQHQLISDIIGQQRDYLATIVTTRETVSRELRKVLSGTTPDATLIQSLSTDYGRADGYMVYLYASRFSLVYQTLTQEQKSKMAALIQSMRYLNPSGAFIYSDAVAMPDIPSTDGFFK